MEVFEIAMSRSSTVRKALKLLRLKHWKFSIETNPMKKSKLRVVIKRITDQSYADQSGKEYNQILGALQDA